MSFASFADSHKALAANSSDVVLSDAIADEMVDTGFCNDLVKR